MVIAVLSVLLFCLVLLRLIGFQGRSAPQKAGDVAYGFSQMQGLQEVQADRGEVVKTNAGVLGILADGIGRENTGKVSAQIAVDTAADAFEPYQTLTNPSYFFRTVFHEADVRIQQTIGERRGGACLALVFIGGGMLHYALAGDIRIGLVRNGELIPLSKGHTLDVLAKEAYEAGKISRKEAIWSFDEKRRWNYVGMDGFHDVEEPEQPIRLKEGDVCVLITRGIWQSMSEAQLEDMLQGTESLAEKARQIAWYAGRIPKKDQENGSVLLLDVGAAARGGNA